MLKNLFTYCRDKLMLGVVIHYADKLIEAVLKIVR